MAAPGSGLWGADGPAAGLARRPLHPGALLSTADATLLLLIPLLTHQARLDGDYSEGCPLSTSRRPKGSLATPYGSRHVPRPSITHPGYAVPARPGARAATGPRKPPGR